MLGRLTAVFFAYLLILPLLASASSATSSGAAELAPFGSTKVQLSQLEQQARIRNSIHQYKIDQKILEEDPVYQMTLNSCRNNDSRLAWKVAWYSTKDGLAIATLDVNRLWVVLANRMRSVEFTLLLESPAFYKALKDCDPSLWKARQIIFGLTVNDFVFKPVAAVVGFEIVGVVMGSWMYRFAKSSSFFLKGLAYTAWTAVGARIADSSYKLYNYLADPESLEEGENLERMVEAVQNMKFPGESPIMEAFQNKISNAKTQKDNPLLSPQERSRYELQYSQKIQLLDAIRKIKPKQRRNE